VTETLTRYAAYIRFSSQMQIGNTSISVQTRTIQDYIARKSTDDTPAIIVESYIDMAQSGKTLKRTELDRLLRDAEKHKFDALIVYDWSRLSRDLLDAKSIKRHLRHDLKIGVFSVLEVGESDNPDNKFLETITEAKYESEADKHGKRVSDAHYQLFLDDWYRGKRPFGYNIKPVVVETRSNGEQVTHNTLEPHETEADIVRMIFDLYVTGKWSFQALVDKLNAEGVKTVKAGLFSTEAVKTILGNHLYLGETSYQKAEYDSQKRRTYTGKPQYKPAKHPALVSQELFDKVQEMRQYRTLLKRKETKVPNYYLLAGMVYCDHCFEAARRGKVQGVTDNFAKCHSHTLAPRNGVVYRFYSCKSRERGYDGCSQKGTARDVIDSQVVSLLSSLVVPDDWRRRLVEQIALEIGDERIAERIATLREEIKRWNIVYASGYIDRTEFEQEQSKRQSELDKLTMADELDTYAVAADLIDNFRVHFDDCDGDVDAQNRLISRLVERVFIRGRQVVRIQFKADVYAVLHYRSDLVRFYDGDGERNDIDDIRDEQLITDSYAQSEIDAAIARVRQTATCWIPRTPWGRGKEQEEDAPPLGSPQKQST
jgi:site-specific DNA recombinase